MQIAGFSRLPVRLIPTHSLSRTQLYRIGLCLVTLLGLLLRLGLLNRFSFREDEALYSFWAWHTWPADPLFLQVWPDKPPLFLWLLAATFHLFGPSQASARWLNIMLSVATIPVVAACAQQLWGRRVALLAVLLFALNPFAISFAATAYTDPMLVLTGMLAYLFALRRRFFWAGLWLGIAIMTKQQGVLYIPLVAGGLLMNFRSKRLDSGFLDSPPAPRYPPLATRYPFLMWFLGMGIMILPILYWDSLRWAVAPSPWDLSIRHYGALTVLAPVQWLARLKSWLSLAWYLSASWPVWVMIMVVGGYALFAKARHVRFETAPTSSQGHHLVTLSPGLLVLLWSLGFLALHIISSVQIWDRYLLPLAPILALLVGRLLSRQLAAFPPRWYWISLCAWGLLLTPPALTAASGSLPVGGDHGAYQGLTEALDWVQREYPARLVLYDQKLGWHYRFYLYEQLTTGRYDLRWFPNAVYLADNANKIPGTPKLLLQPAWAPVQDLKLHLTMHGLTLQERQRFGQLTVYEIRTPSQPWCAWCVCQLPADWPVLSESTASVMRSAK